jgi:hypothetical protein
LENKLQLQEEKKQRREEYRQRIPIEGKFGQGKNGYRLNYIRARTAKTAEAWIRSIFLVMNLLVLAKIFIFSRKLAVKKLLKPCFDLIKQSMAAMKSCFLPTPCSDRL